MPKDPKWFGTAPKMVCPPSFALKQAAKVLRAAAKSYRAERSMDAARALDKAAAALEGVAGGKTWEAAFELAEAVAKEAV